VRFEITAVLLADAMTLYIMMDLKYRIRVGRDGYIRSDYAHKMLTEIREQGVKPNTIRYQML